MYKEVAFDPECLSEYHYYGILRREFGAEKGRFIVAAVNEWAQEAFSVVKNSEIQDVKKKSIKTYLNTLRKNKGGNILVLPSYRESLVDPASVKNWYEWLVAQKQHMEFDATVSERNISGAVNYEAIIDDCEEWSVPPSIRVDRTERAIVEALMPLVRLGTRITIIDQFFKLAGNSVLHELLRRISETGSIDKITIVTSIDTAAPNQVFETEYGSKHPCIPRVDLIVAPERFFHDRYFITNNSAVKSGHGFSDAPRAGTHADRLSLNLCGKNEKVETENDLLAVIGRENTKVIELNR